ncbi:ParB/RepB/Spo0J family partition protein [Ralstonia pseudosolanacearum]|uniref:ParB/RepB/Spo0J family partition protein n=1 Tax=Ralstonia pseudosolanacearum TaxID=1310165 RepID=UPI003043E130|nr:ParB N-terminal domain-containing protein [Ralstonia pseudosolanacearum]
MMQDNLITVPLSRLIDSDANARTGELPRIPELAASISAHGMMYPLVVTEAKMGRKTCYAVAAGRRRRAALELLREQGAIDAEHEVLCLLVDDARAVELSTVENVQREPMHPADAYEAFRKMVDAGSTIEDVAARFGVTPTVVERRLKLAKVSPELIATYRAGDMSLEQLMAMTVTDDHAAQQQVWNSLPRHERTPERLRRTLLGQDTVRSDSGLAAFVGKDVYLQAGGRTQVDLFESTAYWLDGALTRDLACAKLQAEADELHKAEGWAWALALFNPSYGDMSAFGHAPTTSREPTKKEATAIKKLNTRKEQVEREMSDLEEKGDEQTEQYATLSEEWDRIEGELDDIDDRLQVVDDKTHAGVVVYFQNNARHILRGVIKPEDKKAVTKLARAAAQSQPGSGQDAPATDARPLSERLARTLTAQRTAALQAVLIERTDVALTTLAYGLVSSLWAERYWRYNAIGIRTTDTDHALTQADASIEQTRAWHQVTAAREAWAARLPEDRAELWAVLLAMPREELLSLLAFCTAVTVDGIQSRPDAHETDAVAQAVALDMGDWWEATPESYLSHVPKAHVLTAVTEGASAAEAAPLAAMKKGPMVEAAARALAGKRWLPPALRVQHGQ